MHYPLTGWSVVKRSVNEVFSAITFFPCLHERQCHLSVDSSYIERSCNGVA